MMAEDSYFSPGMKENPFYYDGISVDEYEKEREYYFSNFKTLVMEGKYKPLWKQKQEKEQNK